MNRDAVVSNGTVFGAWALGRSIAVVGALLVITFVVIEPEASWGLGVAARFRLVEIDRLGRAGDVGVSRIAERSAMRQKRQIDDHPEAQRCRCKLEELGCDGLPPTAAGEDS